jgi:hypothetical protein
VPAAADLAPASVLGELVAGLSAESSLEHAETTTRQDASAKRPQMERALDIPRLSEWLRVLHAPRACSQAGVFVLRCKACRILIHCDVHNRRGLFKLAPSVTFSPRSVIRVL